MKRVFIVLFGVAFISLATWMAFFVDKLVHAERDPLVELKALTGKRMPKLKAGDPVLIEGVIAKDAKAPLHGLVFGSEQLHKKDSDGYSNWSQKLAIGKGPVPVTLTDGTQVIALIEDTNPRGTFKTVPDPQDEKHRWVGLEPGAKFVAHGRVKSLNPFTVDATYHFGGTSKEYLAFLGNMGWVFWLILCLGWFGGLAALFGVLRRR